MEERHTITIQERCAKEEYKRDEMMGNRKSELAADHAASTS